MPNYRRLRVPGATYFFTVTLADRRSTVLTDRIDLLRAAFRETLAAAPVRLDALVILPDHLHAVWTLPPGDADYSGRWRRIKGGFSRRLGRPGRRSGSKRAKGEHGVWQRPFWEHGIRDAADFARHVQYCWWNPVRHGLAVRVADWPYSTFHRDVRRGVVTADWGGGEEVHAAGERQV